MCFFIFLLFFVLLVQLHTPLLVGFVVSGAVVVYLLTCPNSRLLLMRKLPAITDVCVCDCASSRFARAFAAFVCNLENISFGILVQFETANEFCD